MTTRKRKVTSEVPTSEVPTSEVATSEVGQVEQKEVSTSEVEVATITLTFDEYCQKVRVNPGLQVSYQVEARLTPEMLLPKTEEEWKLAFYDQSHKVYE